MQVIKLSPPIKKSTDIVKLSTNDLTTEHSNIFQYFQNENNNKVNLGISDIFSFLRSIPSFKEFYDSIPSGSSRFEVVFPKDIAEKLQNGDYSFINSGKDEFFAFIRDNKTNKITKQLRIKEVTNIKDYSTHLKSMHNMAVMQALNQIVLQLQAIEKRLIEIHKEFNNDRIGKIQAGYSLFLDAQQLFDNDMKKKILSEAIALLVEGRAQLIESTKVRVGNIETGFLNSVWKELKSWNFSDMQKENSKELVKEIFYIQRSSQIIILAYNSLDEYRAVLQSLAPFNDLMFFLNDQKKALRLEEWENSQNWTKIFENVQLAIEKMPEYEEICDNEITIEINK